MSNATLTNTYIDADDLMAYLNLNGVGSVAATTAYDTEIIRACNSASRKVDDYTHRHFYKENGGAALSKVFWPSHRQAVQWYDRYQIQRGDSYYTQRLTPLTSDCYQINSVAVDQNDDAVFEDTWTGGGTDYFTEPLNAEKGGITNHPVDMLVACGSKLFRTTGFHPSVQVTGLWGWSYIPEPVYEATLRVAAWSFQARNAPMGVQASVEFGGIRMPRDEFSFVQRALAPYRRGSSVVQFG